MIKICVCIYIYIYTYILYGVWEESSVSGRESLWLQRALTRGRDEKTKMKMEEEQLMKTHHSIQLVSDKLHVAQSI